MATKHVAPGTARRVARELSSEFRNTPEYRLEVSYKGGWQNCTQKLEWFWYGFKKYGFLANLANMCRMREAWWESGEKRLVGMDAMGHRYWETDELSRRYSGCHRWIDYPHHFQYADWGKVPQQWTGWAKHACGRSPPQMEALHKELGPAWRDYNDNAYKQPFKQNEADTFRFPQIGDGASGGAEFTNPWDPNFKKVRNTYGKNPKYDTHMINLGGRNVYDVDEFDPKGGVVGKLEVEGLYPDGMQQFQMNKETEGGDHPNQPFCKNGDAYNNMQLEHGDYAPKRGQAIWWHYRKQQADITRRSREAVSAFDDPKFSPVNKAGGDIFGYETRYKTMDENASQGFRGSATNERNVNNVPATSTEARAKDDFKGPPKRS